MNNAKRAHEHAIHVLSDLAGGAYFVMVVDEDLVSSPYAVPTRGAMFMVNGKWMVFSPVECAN